MSKLNEFESATGLFYSNEQVANYNHDQLNKLEHHVVCINARHSSSLAKKARTGTSSIFSEDSESHVDYESMVTCWSL